MREDIIIVRLTTLQATIKTSSIGIAIAQEHQRQRIWFVGFILEVTSADSVMFTITWHCQEVERSLQTELGAGQNSMLEENENNIKTLSACLSLYEHMESAWTHGVCMNTWSLYEHMESEDIEMEFPWCY